MFKVRLSSSKNIFFDLLQWKPFKSDEKCFLFHAFYFLPILCWTEKKFLTFSLNESCWNMKLENFQWNSPNPVGIYLLKANNRNIRTRCEISSKLKPCSSVCIMNFEHVIAGWEELAQRSKKDLTDLENSLRLLETTINFT